MYLPHTRSHWRPQYGRRYSYLFVNRLRVVDIRDSPGPAFCPTFHLATARPPMMTADVRRLQTNFAVFFFEST